MLRPFILLLCCYCIKLPQTGWLKITILFSLSFQGQSLKSRYQHGLTPFGSSKGKSDFSSFWSLLASLACGHITLISTVPFTFPSPLCIFSYVYYKSTLNIGPGWIIQDNFVSKSLLHMQRFFVQIM